MENINNISKCSNCGTQIPEDAKYCPNCGQSTKRKKINLFDFFKDFMDNFLILDFKSFKTLKALLIPGKLTLNYFSGKIKRYISPWRLFFVSILLMLIVIGFNIKMNNKPKRNYIKNKITGTFQVEKKNIIDSLDIIDSLKTRDTLTEIGLISVINTIPGAKKNQKFKIDTLKNILDREDYSYIKQLYNDINSYQPKDSIISVIIDSSSIVLTSLLRDVYVDSTSFSDTRISKFDIKNMPLKDLKDKYGLKDSKSSVFKSLNKSVRYKFKGGKWNKKKFRDFFIKNLNWFIIFLMPITALIFKLLYIRRKRFFIEHLVFNLHNHSAILILYTIFILLSWTNNDIITDFSGIILMFAPGIYYILAMKRYYQQSWGKTIIKFLIFSGLYFLALLLALIVYFIIAALVI